MSEPWLSFVSLGQTYDNTAFRCITRPHNPHRPRCPSESLRSRIERCTGQGPVLELAFYTKPPSPQIVDKMLRQSLEQAASIDGTRDILAMAFLGEEVLTGT